LDHEAEEELKIVDFQSQLKGIKGFEGKSRRLKSR
jgi:hypothetical protein